MLNYEDCVGLCGLTAGEIAAIARHEHLPEIVALELGAHLATTHRGRCAIEAMIRDDVAAAREQGDAREAARLELVLRELTSGHAVAASEDMLEQRILALGFDGETAPWVRRWVEAYLAAIRPGLALHDHEVRRRVEAYLAAMGRAFGVELAGLRDRFPLELLAAETRCSACEETARCRPFLAGAEDEPREFCPNAGVFAELRRAS